MSEPVASEYHVVGRVLVSRALLAEWEADGGDIEVDGRIRVRRTADPDLLDITITRVEAEQAG